MNNASRSRDPRARVLRTYPHCSRGCGRSAVEISVLGDIDLIEADEADLEALCAVCHGREVNTRRARGTRPSVNGAPERWRGPWLVGF